MLLQDVFDRKEAQRERKGVDAFGRDRRLLDKTFAEQVDNCASKLHAVR
jgi:hypothetical protein